MREMSSAMTISASLISHRRVYYQDVAQEGEEGMLPLYRVLHVFSSEAIATAAALVGQVVLVYLIQSLSDSAV